MPMRGLVMSAQKAADGSVAMTHLLLQQPDSKDTAPRGGASHPAESDGLTVRRPVTKPSHPTRPKGKVTPEKVLHAFNTWAFKREQPDDALIMLQVISRSMALGEPIPFVLYWGKGPRASMGAPEKECLKYIASLAGRVYDAYSPGATVKLIFTDTHAELNGHSQSSIWAYFAEIEACARSLGFGHCWMSHLTPAAKALDAKDPHDDPIPDDAILAQLVTSAAKWYHGAETPQRAALAYYRLNMVEKRAVEIAFPHSIFITFNGGRLRSLFPKRMPIFYMYSLRRGVSIKPWFFTTEPSH
jgi:hypothetical protein